MSRSLVFFAAVGLFACKTEGPDVVADDPRKAIDLKFTGGAIESLPQQAMPSGGLTSGESIAGQMQLAKFFKQECHMYPQANFCPAGIDAAAKDGMNDFKFSATTLLGLVYHAEMYSGGLRSTCEGKTTTLTSASFAAAADAGVTDPTRYLIDILPLLSCLEVDDSGGSRSYRAHSTQPKYQATLTTRHQAPSGGGPLQTDIMQVYVLVDDKQTPSFLAFNWAGVSSMTARAVLLANLVNHRFAVRYLSGPAAQADYVTAVGVGGIDRASGQARQGFYRARYTGDAREPKQACIDNATQLLEIDDTECIAAGVPISWTNADTVATYLGMTGDETTQLAGFLAKFATHEPLSTSEAPDGPGDADLFFPARIE